MLHLRVVGGVHGLLEVLDDIVGTSLHVLLVGFVLLLPFCALEYFARTQVLSLEILKEEVHLIKNENKGARREVLLVANILEEGSGLHKAISRVFITLVGIFGKLTVILERMEREKRKRLLTGITTRRSGQRTEEKTAKGWCCGEA
jgi:hypothetical protein